MMTTRRCAGTVALMTIVAAALIFGGCGGGGDGGAGTAQTGFVSGTITYAATGDGLGGIHVSIGNITTTTDAAGQFTLRRVPIGDQTLRIHADPDRGLVLPPGVPLTVRVRGEETTTLPAPIQMIDEIDAPPGPPARVS